MVQLGAAGAIAALLFLFRDRNSVAVLTFSVVALIVAALVFSIIFHVMRQRRTMKRLKNSQPSPVTNMSRENP
jgi:Flp pilus assembly protein TadB